MNDENSNSCPPSPPPNGVIHPASTSSSLSPGSPGSKYICISLRSVFQPINPFVKPVVGIVESLHVGNTSTALPTATHALPDHTTQDSISNNKEILDIEDPW